MSSESAMPDSGKQEVRVRRGGVATLGMFIIDVFKVLDPETGVEMEDKLERGEQIGGGGIYFAVGARVWLPPSKVLSIIDAGPDFTSNLRDKLESFNAGSADKQSMWAWRARKDGTTRAVNIYRGEHRDFQYLTPKIRLEYADVLQFAEPSWLHCVCSPERVKVVCRDAKRWQSQQSGTRQRSRIVWEPIPDSAVAANLNELLDAIVDVDILSPNHDEASALLSLPSLPTVSTAEASSLAALREAIETKLALGLRRAFEARHGGGKICPLIVVRAGALGSVCVSDAGVRWCEAWHDASRQDKVVDVTGAGNAFLGGFTASLATTEEHDAALLTQSLAAWPVSSLDDALRAGAVSASFALEQLGLPDVKLDEEAKKLRWNGDLVADRLESLADRSNK